jgi:hypothetical protein
MTRLGAFLLLLLILLLLLLKGGAKQRALNIRFMTGFCCNIRMTAASWPSATL